MYKQPININSPTAYVFWNLLAVIPPATDCERLCTHDQRLSLPLLNALHLILKRTCFSTAGIPLSQCLDTNDIEAKVTDRLTTTDILWDCKPARILRDMQTVLGERERVGFAAMQRPMHPQWATPPPEPSRPCTPPVPGGSQHFRVQRPNYK